ncbi:hypothetical protein WA588_000206 [Blastocystis sp. NMH]
MVFAWNVMNCVLEDAGRKKYVCKARSVRTCTSLLPDSILPIYTQFLNHADTVCFYQKFHNWERKMERTTSKLSSQSEEMKQNLSESNEKQNLVLAKQNSLSKQSEEIKEQGDAILHVVSDTRNELQSYYRNISLSFSQVGEDMLDALHNITSLLSFTKSQLERGHGLSRIFSLFSDAWKLTFVWLLLVLLLTSVSMFRPARPWLLAALLSYWCAQPITHWLLKDVLRKEALGVAEYWSTWLFVGVFCLNGYQCVVMSLPKKGADQQF